VSHESLVQAYIAALPFAAVAIVAVPGGGCRVAVGGEPAPGETTIARYFFKPLHIELVLGAAGLADSPIDDAPAAVAALIERTARRMGAPYETESEIRAAAKIQVAEIVARVEASNQAGGLKQVNAQYKRYRQAQIARAEKALPYSKFIEPFIATIVRGVAMSGRMI
jgi:hypothetical protein